MDGQDFGGYSISMNNLKQPLGAIIFAVVMSQAGCTPRVEVVAPSEPITINLNVKIDHEVRVRVEKDLDKVISKESGLF